MGDYYVCSNVDVHTAVVHVQLDYTARLKM